MGQELHAVTGAYGYSGKYIAQRLLDEGQTVITLTDSLSRANPFGDRIKAFPFHFDQPELLAEQLKGVSVLYNTYWVRFNHSLFKHADAVQNTRTLCCGECSGDARRRCDHHQGRNRRPDGRPSVRGLATNRHHGADPVGQGARRHLGPEVHERIGATERPNHCVPVELSPHSYVRLFPPRLGIDAGRA